MTVYKYFHEQYILDTPKFNSEKKTVTKNNVWKLKIREFNI